MLTDRIINFFTSLKLTVWCLALSLVLVFFGTMAQEPLGLYIAQEKFFRSFFVDAAPMLAAIKKTLQMFGVYLQPMTSEDVITGSRIPVFPGGYLLGTVLLLNLMAAHYKRFELSMKKAGIFLIHAGIILLLLGQLFTDLLSQESNLRLREGQTKNYSESSRESELAIVDVTDPQKNAVVAVDERLLARGGELSPEGLPFSIRVKHYFRNSSLANRPSDSDQPPLATHGLGPRVIATNLAPVTDMDFRDVPTAVVELLTREGSLGTWLVSGWIDQPQPVTVAGRTYHLTLRLKRFYKPFSITLLDFSHDKYTGTEIPMNFSSRIRLQRPETGEDREVLIYMNNPLRYWGETYYQASFDKNDDKVTILQVVRNPSWLTPYVACVLVGLGLVVQFMMHLVGFTMRRRTT